MRKIITFMGPDGSGKSTLLKELEVYLKTKFTEKNISVIHFKPALLRKAKNVETLPYKKKPHNIFISLIKIIVWTIEYNLYFLCTPKDNHVVLFDRHLLDIFTDPRRYRIRNTLTRLSFVYSLVIPKPDIIFYMNGEPEIINKRKNEVSLQQTMDQMQHYMEILRNKKNVHYINCCLSKSLTMNTIIEVVDKEIYS